LGRPTHAKRHLLDTIGRIKVELKKKLSAVHRSRLVVQLSETTNSLARLECQTKREKRLKPRSRPGRPRKQLPLLVRVVPSLGEKLAIYLIDGTEISVPIPGSTARTPMSKAEAAELTREALDNLLANQQRSASHGNLPVIKQRTAAEQAAADRMLGIVPTKQTAAGASAKKPPSKAIRKSRPKPSPEVQTLKADQDDVSPKIADSEPAEAAAECDPEIIRTVADSTSGQTEPPNGSSKALPAQPQATVTPELRTLIARLEELLKGASTTAGELAGYLSSESIKACGIGPEQEAYLRDRFSQYIMQQRAEIAQVQREEEMFEPVIINGKSVFLTPSIKTEIQETKLRALSAIKTCRDHVPERCPCWWNDVWNSLIPIRKSYGDGSGEDAYAEQIWTEIEDFARTYKPPKVGLLSKISQAFSELAEDNSNAAPDWLGRRRQ